MDWQVCRCAVVQGNLARAVFPLRGRLLANIASAMRLLVGPADLHSLCVHTSPCLFVLISRLLPLEMPFTSEYTRLHDDPEPAGSQTKAILFLDIDNTLYSSKVIGWSLLPCKSADALSLFRRPQCGISDQMKDLIQAYFEKLGLSKEEANRLHATYYREYGLR